MADEVPGFIDAENHQGGGKSELNFRLIVLEHYRRILSLASTEWHGGYWKEKINRAGIPTTEYEPATHAAYANAVDALADALHPHFDKEMLAAEADCEKRLSLIREQVRSATSSSAESLKEEWLYSRAENRRVLFRYLSDFLMRKGYLEAGVFGD